MHMLDLVAQFSRGALEMITLPFEYNMLRVPMINYALSQTRIKDYSFVFSDPYILYSR